MRQVPDNLSGFPNPVWGGCCPPGEGPDGPLAVGGPQGQSKCWHSRKSLSKVMLPPHSTQPPTLKEIPWGQRETGQLNQPSKTAWRVLSHMVATRHVSL